MKIWISVLKFLFLGALFIVANENLYLNDQVDRTTFTDLFYTWLDTLYQHSLQITGYVVDSEWLPEQNSQGPLEGVG